MSTLHEQAWDEAAKRFGGDETKAEQRRTDWKDGLLAGRAAATRTRVVTTVTELDALRVGSVVLDRHGYPWLKGTGSWVCTSDGGVIEPHEVAPLTVLYEPEETR